MSKQMQTQIQYKIVAVSKQATTSAKTNLNFSNKAKTTNSNNVKKALPKFITKKDFQAPSEVKYVKRDALIGLGTGAVVGAGTLGTISAGLLSEIGITLSVISPEIPALLTTIGATGPWGIVTAAAAGLVAGGLVVSGLAVGIGKMVRAITNK